MGCSARRSDATRLRRALAVLSAVAVCTAGAGAEAAKPAKAAAKKKPAAAAAEAGRARAKMLSIEAEKHYMLAEYDRAIDKYREAYLLLPDPIFLFNVGQAFRKSGRFEDALRFYRNYLLAAPTAANKAEAEKFIEDMKRSLATAAAEAESAAAAAAAAAAAEAAAAEAAKRAEEDAARASALGPPATDPAPRRGPGKGAWLVLGMAAVVVVGGGVALSVYLLTRDAEDPWVADFRP